MLWGTEFLAKHDFIKKRILAMPENHWIMVVDQLINC